MILRKSGITQLAFCFSMQISVQNLVKNLKPIIGTERMGYTYPKFIKALTKFLFESRKQAVQNRGFFDHITEIENPSRLYETDQI